MSKELNLTPEQARALIRANAELQNAQDMARFVLSSVFRDHGIGAARTVGFDERTNVLTVEELSEPEAS